jgi:hypothetical protein
MKTYVRTDSLQADIQVTFNVIIVACRRQQVNVYKKQNQVIHTRKPDVDSILVFLRHSDNMEMSSRLNHTTDKTTLLNFSNTYGIAIFPTNQVEYVIVSRVMCSIILFFVTKNWKVFFNAVHIFSKCVLWNIVYLMALMFV